MKNIKDKWINASRATILAGIILLLSPFMALKTASINPFLFYFSLIYGGIGILFFFLSKKIRNENHRALTIVTWIWGLLILDTLIGLIATQNWYSMYSVVIRIIILVYMITPNKKIQAEVEKLQAKKDAA